MKSKQVIVMRTDLGMRKGKMIAQGSHASLAVFTQMMSPRYGIFSDKIGESYEYALRLPEGKIGDEVHEWIEGKFTKICVRATSEEELLEVYNKAKDAGLPCSLIRDAGDTEFHGVPTHTCCAIGPAHEDRINPITGDLKLL